MILYDLEKANLQKSAAYSVMGAFVMIQAILLIKLGAPLSMVVLWSLIVFVGLGVLAGFFMAVGRAQASMEIFKEIEAADIPFTVHDRG